MNDFDKPLDLPLEYFEDNYFYPFKPTRRKRLMGGVQHVFDMPDGGEISVICHRGSYGGDEGLWEAMIGGSDNVRGWMTQHQVLKVLIEFAAMPAEQHCPTCGK